MRSRLAKKWNQARNESRDVEITDTVGDNTKIGDVVVNDARMAEEHGDSGIADTGEKQVSDNDVKEEQVEKKSEVKENKRRKKRTREDKFEKVMNVIIEKVTQAQK